MAHRGDILENPITGERIIIIETAESTNGAACVGDLSVRPHGFVAAEHTHPMQEETFVVTKGTIRFRINGKEEDAHIGQVVVIPVGALHSWWNASDEEVGARVTFKPALNTETFFETFFGLARDGKTDSLSRPKPLQTAILAWAYKNEIQLALPMKMRILLRALTPFAWLLGYRARYLRYSGPQRISAVKELVY